MKVMAVGPVYNEGEKALKVVERFPFDLVDELVIVDDASTDDTPRKLRKSGATILTMERRSGPGTAMRRAFDYGLDKGYDVFVVFAMNGKDNPREIPRLLAPLKEGRADYVHGSRYLEGGGWQHMPFHRIWGIRAFTILFRLFLRFKITDGTNGFRAFRTSILRDKRINVWQNWLEGYPLETYLFAQTIRTGYRVVEVPVTKTYPKSKKNYSKMRPLIDWWNYFKPIPLLCLGLKK